MEYEPVIGLEVHAQLLTRSKIFCGCSTSFGEEPNTQTCPVCTGQPGSLPVINRKAVEFAIKLGLATNCRIAPYSLFARKNYFYPDLPKGYQISMYEYPLAEHGFVDITVKGEKRRIGLIRIHMEEDAGKLKHGETPEKAPFSYVDFNRTGVPLVEIVSGPDIRSPQEAGEYLRRLRAILQYLEVCTGDMEKGTFRCDANVSVRPKGQTQFGTRTELKNMNSFRNVEKALEYEIKRQIEVLKDGEEVIQETRLWDTDQNITVSMRGKEEAHDYRYFPDPDLVPLRVDDQWIEEIRKGLPELPDQKRERFIQDYKIPEYDAEILTSTKAMANFFEDCVRLFPEPKTVSNWMMGDLLREMKRDEKEIEQCLVTPKHLAEMLTMMKEGTISGKIAKDVFEEMYRTGDWPAMIVKEKGWVQILDTGEIEGVVENVLQSNPKLVEDYRNGKEKVFGFLVGEVMKGTKGKANPKLVNELLRKKLKG
ncbi:MAG: Asp-tRNA(Asn)/Glu-tRNA(Gln) amidotransferase subunit GatB [Deltaproteobacteria bacterium]|nr:Asp-tRNA(Asn)/Glu-tRNA(Gln) amidotransferase subunit GatB [Deltaproteobacteria bacterium]MBM4325252.1 Asp-tRNA(Asn)/Glu-tRNA(Gln) amidotransferase subunit GatB [Deltaproteobacteria bacterium]